MIKAILFDLDGTLLPMDANLFVKLYFSTLTNKTMSYGYEPKELMKNILKGTNAMINNDGKITNEAVFWNLLSQEYGPKVYKDIPLFDEYYDNEFNEVKKCCGYNSKSKEVVSLCKNRGYKVILATNPIFPKVATDNRIKWAGLDTKDFDYYTTYENSYHSKPNLEYYNDILNKFNLDAIECVMIGNNVDEDMIAKELGMKTFLLTDCLINEQNKDIEIYEKGSFDELIKFINKLK